MRAKRGIQKCRFEAKTEGQAGEGQDKDNAHQRHIAPVGVHEDERSADDSQRQHQGDKRPCHPYQEGNRHCARCHQQPDSAAPDQRSGRKYSPGKVSVGGLNHPRKYTTAPPHLRAASPAKGTPCGCPPVSSTCPVGATLAGAPWPIERNNHQIRDILVLPLSAVICREDNRVDTEKLGLARRTGQPEMSGLRNENPSIQFAIVLAGTATIFFQCRRFILQLPCLPLGQTSTS